MQSHLPPQGCSVSEFGKQSFILRTFAKSFVFTSTLEEVEEWVQHLAVYILKASEAMTSVRPPFFRSSSPSLFLASSHRTHCSLFSYPSSSSLLLASSENSLYLFFYSLLFCYPPFSSLFMN